MSFGFIPVSYGIISRVIHSVINKNDQSNLGDQGLQIDFYDQVCDDLLDNAQIS